MMVILMIVLLSEPVMINFLKNTVLEDWEDQSKLSLLWSQSLNSFTNVIDNIQIINGISIDNSRIGNFDFGDAGDPNHFKWQDSEYSDFIDFYSVIMDQNMGEIIKNITLLERSAKSLDLVDKFGIFTQLNIDTLEPLNKQNNARRRTLTPQLKK